MKLLIAGSRSITPDAWLIPSLISQAEFGPALITTVISGGARGVDRAGEDWARANQLAVEVHLPDWNLHGRRAGFVRNAAMVAQADVCLVIWDGHSHGTLNTINLARKKGIPLFVYNTRDHNTAHH